MSKPSPSEIAEARHILSVIMANGMRNGQGSVSHACMAAQLSVLDWVVGAELTPKVARRPDGRTELAGTFSTMLASLKTACDEFGINLSPPDRSIKGGSG